MRKTNKNAFTLIELLAVIVILAIIALIAVPTVMDIINKAGKSAFKDSAYGILKAGELFYSTKDMKGELLEKTIFTFPNDVGELKINGELPTGGTMTIDKDGKVSMAITNGRYCITKWFEDDDITISDDVENCEVVSPYSLTVLAKTHTFIKETVATSTTIQEQDVVDIPACIISKTKCAAGTPVAVEVAPNIVYKFYVLNDDTIKNEVTLIMDRNLHIEDAESYGLVPWISEDDYNDATVSGVAYNANKSNLLQPLYNSNNKVLVQPMGAGCRAYTDKGPLTALTTLEAWTSKWTNIPTYTYILENDDDGLGGGYTYPSIERKNVRARMMSLSEVNSLCEDGCPEYLYGKTYINVDDNTYEIGYWLSTTYSTYKNGAWVMFESPDWENICVEQFGIRPVITLSK